MRYLLLLLPLFLLPGYSFSQEVFTGKITRTRYYVFDDYDAVKSSVRVSPKDTIKITNYVCADTIINISTKNSDDKILKTVDHGKYMYIYDNERGYYLKTPILPGRIESIPNNRWKKIKRSGDGYMLKAPHPRMKDRRIKLIYDPTHKYIEQSKLGAKFSELFFHLGLLTKVSVENTTYNYESVIVNKFEEQPVNCKDIIGNFVIKDVSEDEWVRSYFKQADTTLINIRERLPFTDNYTDFLPFDDNSTDVVQAFSNKVVYVDFWASWCAPCRKEIPFLREIRDKYSAEELSIVSISLNKLEGLEKWTEAINTLSMPWFNYLLKGGFEHYLIKQLEIQAIPWYILIDKQGKVAVPHAPRPSDPRIEGLIDQLIDEK